MQAEWREATSWPFESLLVVLANAGLFLVAVFVVPVEFRDWLVTLHGPLAFAMLLQSWMVADVPATNVLGSSPRRALQALQDPDPAAMRHYLLAKIALMWLLTAPACAVTAVVIGVRHHDILSAVSVALTLLVIPLPMLAIASWLGILLPYQQRSLTWRWRHRRDWRTQTRWLVLIFAPWFAVPPIGSALLAALFIVPRLLGLPRGQRWGPEPFLLGALLVIAVSVPVFFLGRWIALQLVRRRRAALLRYLGSPTAG